MDSSDESSGKRESLLSKFMSCRGTNNYSERQSGNKNHASTQDQQNATRTASAVKSPNTAENPHPSPSRPRGRPPRRGLLAALPRKSLIEQGHEPLAERTHTRGGNTAIRSSGARQATRYTTHQKSVPTSNRAGAPRPRRSNARFTNYYSKSNYSGYDQDSDYEEDEDQEDEKEETNFSSKKPAASSSSNLHVQRSQCNKPPRVIYSSKDLRICRHSFTSFDNIVNLSDKVPYSPEIEPARYAQRLKRDESNAILHVSFSDEEIEAMIILLALHSSDMVLSEMTLVDQIIHVVNLIPVSRLERCFIGQIKRMKKLQRLLAKNGFDSLAAYHQASELIKPQKRELIDSMLNSIFSGPNVSLDPSKCLSMAARLKGRRTADISAFIADARQGSLPTKPYYIRATRNCASVKSCLRGGQRSVRVQHGSHSSCRLRRSQTWKGASNDVINLSWSPDGTKFAVGAAAQCDEHNMQYNRSNNLLLGDLIYNSIRELPDHRIPYPGANATNSHLYMSVSAVQWFGDVLYTASYDKTVKVWDVSSYADAICTRTLRHDFKVQVMARHINANVLATGTDETVQLWHMDSLGDVSQSLDFAKQRSIKNSRMIRNVDLLPSTLTWGPSWQTSDLLVAGFSGKESHEGDACREGLLAMWRMTESSMEPFQVQPNAQNIFDVKFHPTMPWFATGSSVPPMGTNGTGKDVRSLVRLYEPSKKRRCAIELDCPALDINDVTFCPMDRSLISASCTDGITYVWDYRNSGQILHKLAHGEALNQLDEQLTREQADVGVRVALWGNTIDNFITGGSDGVLKAWDILRAPEDVFVEEIAAIEDEIMSGTFSPDKSTLLIGDAAGGIHVFSPGASPDAVETINFDYGHDDEESPELPSDSGKSIGRQLLSSGQLIQHPTYGVGKGPAYNGPYAAWARPEGTPAKLLSVTPLLDEYQSQQLEGPVTKPSFPGLDDVSKTILDMQRQVAEIRNKVSHKRKRSTDTPRRTEPRDVINLCSDEEGQKPAGMICIDLTGDTESDDDVDDTGSVDEESDLGDYWFPDSRDVDANIRYSSV